MVWVFSRPLRRLRRDFDLFDFMTVLAFWIEVWTASISACSVSSCSSSFLSHAGASVLLVRQEKKYGNNLQARMESWDSFWSPHCSHNTISLIPHSARTERAASSCGFTLFCNFRRIQSPRPSWCSLLMKQIRRSRSHIRRCFCQKVSMKGLQTKETCSCSAF